MQRGLEQQQELSCLFRVCLLLVLISASAASDASACAACVHLISNTALTHRTEIAWSALTSNAQGPAALQNNNTTTLSGGNTIVTNCSCVVLADVTVVSAAVVVNISSLVHARRDGACEPLRRVTIAINNVMLRDGAALVVAGADGGAISSPAGCDGSSVALNVTSSRFLNDSVAAVSPGNFSLLPNFTLLIFNTTFERNSATDVAVNTPAQKELRMPGVDDGAQQQFAFIVVSGLVLRSGSTLTVRSVTLTAVFESLTNDTYSFGSVKIARGCAVSDHSSIIFSGVVASATTSLRPSARVDWFVGGLWFHAAPLLLSNWSTLVVDGAWWRTEDRSASRRVVATAETSSGLAANILFEGLGATVCIDTNSTWRITSSSLSCAAFSGTLACSNVEMLPDFSVTAIGLPAAVVIDGSSTLELTHATLKASSENTGWVSNVKIRGSGGWLVSNLSALVVASCFLETLSNNSISTLANIFVDSEVLTLRNRGTFSIVDSLFVARFTTGLPALNATVANMLLVSSTVRVALESRWTVHNTTFLSTANRSRYPNGTLDGLVLSSLSVQSTLFRLETFSAMHLFRVRMECATISDNRTRGSKSSVNIFIDGGSLFSAEMSSQIEMVQCTLIANTSRSDTVNILFAGQTTRLLCANITLRQCSLVSSSDGGGSTRNALFLDGTSLLAANASTISLEDTTLSTVTHGTGSTNNILAFGAFRVTSGSRVIVVNASFNATSLGGGGAMTIYFLSGEENVTSLQVYDGSVLRFVDCNFTSLSRGSGAGNIRLDVVHVEVRRNASVIFDRCVWLALSSSEKSAVNVYITDPRTSVKVDSASRVVWFRCNMTALVEGAGGAANVLLTGGAAAYITVDSNVSLIKCHFHAEERIAAGKDFVTNIRFSTNTTVHLASGSFLLIEFCQLSSAAIGSLAASVAGSESTLHVHNSRIEILNTALRVTSHGVAGCLLFANRTTLNVTFSPVSDETANRSALLVSHCSCVVAGGASGIAFGFTDSTNVVVTGPRSQITFEALVVDCSSHNAAAAWYFGGSRVYVVDGGVFSIQQSVVNTGVLTPTGTAAVVASHDVTLIDRAIARAGFTSSGTGSVVRISDSVFRSTGSAISCSFGIRHGGSVEFVRNAVTANGFGVAVSNDSDVDGALSVWTVANNSFANLSAFTGCVQGRLSLSAGGRWELKNNTIAFHTGQPPVWFLAFPPSRSQLLIDSSSVLVVDCDNTIAGRSVSFSSLLTRTLNVPRAWLRKSLPHACVSMSPSEVLAASTSLSGHSTSLSSTMRRSASLFRNSNTWTVITISSRTVSPNFVRRSPRTLSLHALTLSWMLVGTTSTAASATVSLQRTTHSHRSAGTTASLRLTWTQTRSTMHALSVAPRQGCSTSTATGESTRSRTTLSPSVGLPTSDTHRATASRIPGVQAPATASGAVPTVQYGNQLLAAASSAVAAAASGGASAMSGSLMRVALGNNLFKDCNAATMGREADGNYLGLRVGEETGASFRGVVVWSACVLCGCVVVACCAVGVVAARLDGEMPLLRRVVAAQSTLRLPSLLLVPYNTLVTPGVAACVALVGVSAVDTAVCVVLTLLFGGVVAHCAYVLLPRRAFGAVLAPTRLYDGRGQLLVSGVTGWRLRVLRFCDGRSDCKEWVCAQCAFEARYRQRHRMLPPAADFVRRYGKLFQAAVGRWWWYDASEMAASFAAGVVVGVSSKSPSACRLGVWVYAALQVVMCVAVCWLRPYATALRRCVSCAVGVCGVVSVVLVAVVRWCGAGCDAAADVFALAATCVVVFALVLKLVAVALMALRSQANDEIQKGGEMGSAFTTAALNDLVDETFAPALGASPEDDTSNCAGAPPVALTCDMLQVLVSMICRKVQCGELTPVLRVKFVDTA